MKFLPKIVFSLVGNTALFWVLQHYVFPANILIETGIQGFVVVAALFGLINFFVKPVVNLLTFPIRWLTLGLFQLVVNAGLIYVLEWITHMFQFFDVTLTITGGVLTYVLIGAIVACANAVLHWFER